MTIPILETKTQGLVDQSAQRTNSRDYPPPPTTKLAHEKINTLWGRMGKKTLPFTPLFLNLDNHMSNEHEKWIAVSKHRDKRCNRILVALL